jgi:Flp pilus assembly pilin Flp
MPATLVPREPDIPLEEEVIEPTCATEGAGRPRQGRRAATSMEYLVMASFILVVLIVGVQSFGVSVARMFQVDANATSQKPPP